MSNRLHPLTQFALVLALVAVAGVAMTARAKPAERLAPAPPSPAVIAMIDLPKVLDGLAERKKKDDALNASLSDLKKRVEAADKELDAEKQRIDAMPNTAEKLAAAKAFRERKIRNDFDRDYGKALISEQQAEALKELSGRIADAAAQLSKARGYHLVISNDQDVQVRGNTDQITQTLSLKRFIYVDPIMDITEELVQFMNNQYATGAGAGAGAGAGTKP